MYLKKGVDEVAMKAKQKGQECHNFAQTSMQSNLGTNQLLNESTDKLFPMKGKNLLPRYKLAATKRDN